MDSKGTYGIAVLEVADESTARNIAENDPAIKAEAGFSFESHKMPDAIVRPQISKNWAPKKNLKLVYRIWQESPHERDYSLTLSWIKRYLQAIAGGLTNYPPLTNQFSCELVYTFCAVSP